MNTAGDRVLAAIPSGSTAVIETFLRECVGLVRLKATGIKARKIIPTVLVERVTSSTNSGEVTQFGTRNFRNGTSMHFVARAFIPALLTSSNGTDQAKASSSFFRVVDRRTGESILGGPQRVNGTQLVDAFKNPTSLAYFAGEGHMIPPEGGLDCEVQSNGTSEQIEVLVPGYWVEQW